MKAACTLLMAAVLPALLFAQGKWELGLVAGGVNYKGDLVESFEPIWSETQLAYGVFLRKTYYFRYGLRFSLNGGQLSGSDQHAMDSERRARNFAFTSNYLEAALRLEWEPFGPKRLPGPRQFRAILSPYLYAGLAFASFRTDPDFSQSPRDGLLEKIERDEQKGTIHNTPAFPIGAGIKYDLGKKVVVALEAGLRATLSDYLDGTSISSSTTYNDWYFFGGINFAYRFKAKDTDKDGFADIDDDCPRVAGNLSAYGCPDSDGDGIEDLEDICPDQSGLAALNGCPDLDKDGVADLNDECPYQKGTLFTEGCPDTDLDQIKDSEDKCPKLSGILCKCGCPLLDTNGDGNINEKSRCNLRTKGEDILTQAIEHLTPLESMLALDLQYMPV